MALNGERPRLVATIPNMRQPQTMAVAVLEIKSDWLTAETAPSVVRGTLAIVGTREQVASHAAAAGIAKRLCDAVRTGLPDGVVILTMTKENEVMLHGAKRKTIIDA